MNDRLYLLIGRCDRCGSFDVPTTTQAVTLGYDRMADEHKTAEQQHCQPCAELRMEPSVSRILNMARKMWKQDMGKYHG